MYNTGRAAAADGLVDGRRWMDRLAVRPHAFVQDSQSNFVGLLDQGIAFGPEFVRLSREHGRHGAALPSSFFNAFLSPPAERARRGTSAPSGHPWLRQFRATAPATSRTKASNRP